MASVHHLNSPAETGRVVSRPATSLATANRWLAVFLVTVLCVSGLRFCYQIALTYIVPLFGGDLQQWNGGFLPGLYDPDNAGSTRSIGLHFVTGALVMVLGCVQMVNLVRRRWPRIHRWIGRFYVVTAVLTALGGLGFIVLQGTVGGAAMNVGFGLYGVLMIIAAVLTIRYARAGEFKAHRAWAVRLFALVIASWLYRLEYGFGGLLELGGRTADFRGWFDLVMNFFFYIPNLVIAELYLRSQRSSGTVAVRSASLAALTASAVVVLGGLVFQLSR